MSAKTKTPAKKAAKKAAAKKPVAAKKSAAKKSAAKKAVSKPAPKEIKDGDEIVFIGFRTPIEGTSELTIGDKLFVSSKNEDDGTYNVARTPRAVPIDTLYREEFRLASEEASADEVQNTGKPATVEPAKGKASGKAKTTEAEDTAGTKVTGKAAKDSEGRTVKKVAAKKAGKKAEPEAAPEPPAPVKLVGSAKAAVAEHGGDLITAALELVAATEATNYTLGGILAKIQETNAHETLVNTDGDPIYGTGHAAFGRFCEVHLGMKYRKATYLVGIYTTCQRLGITEKQISGIGWSKLKEALRALTVDNKDEILSKAKQLPYDEFKAAMKKELVNSGSTLHGNTSTLITFTFRFHNDKAEVVREALEKAKAKAGIEGTDVTAMSAALDNIITDWVSMQD